MAVVERLFFETRTTWKFNTRLMRRDDQPLERKRVAARCFFVLKLIFDPYHVRLIPEEFRSRRYCSANES